MRFHALEGRGAAITYDLYTLFRSGNPRTVGAFSSLTYEAVENIKHGVADNHRKDEIIEIGVVAFSFDGAGNVGEVTHVYGALQQPSIPIPEEVKRLTGITDAMVAGQVIDLHRLRSIVDAADLIIAHNAGFDRPFCEAFSPIFTGKAWACSVSEIDWTLRGFEGTKLGYLIGQAGYFHEGHRAVDDCFALLEVLARMGESRGTRRSPSSTNPASDHGSACSQKTARSI